MPNFVVMVFTKWEPSKYRRTDRRTDRRISSFLPHKNWFTSNINVNGGGGDNGEIVAGWIYTLGRSTCRPTFLVICDFNEFGQVGFHPFKITIRYRQWLEKNLSLRNSCKIDEQTLTLRYLFGIILN